MITVVYPPGAFDPIPTMRMRFCMYWKAPLSCR